MNEQQVFDKIRTIIVDQLGVDEDKITRDTTFQDDRGADSLEIVELVMEMEDQFGREIPDEDAENLTTVGKAVDYVMSQQ